jgi:hypothetical protein
MRLIIKKFGLIGYVFALVSVFDLIGIPTDAWAEKTWWIHTKAKAVSPFKVEAELTTNIPSNAMLAVRLSLHGQKPENIAIGTEFVAVPISGGKGKVTIDGQFGTFPVGRPLPSGSYDLKASFYPQWEENKAVAAKAGIREVVKSDVVVVKLTGSGVGTAEAKKLAEGQAWVMRNVNVGDRWDPAFWQQKFGPLQEVPYRGIRSARFIHNYYIKSIDMTLTVNTFLGKIYTWRSGLTDH